MREGPGFSPTTWSRATERRAEPVHGRQANAAEAEKRLFTRAPLQEGDPATFGRRVGGTCVSARICGSRRPRPHVRTAAKVPARGADYGLAEKV